MSFLAPLWLALAGAVAVPLLIHLLRRRIGVKVEFPAARYLARAEQEHSRSLRMRNLLLMLLRVLVVIALALAAARPVTRWVGAGHAPTALAIVVDNSLSSSAVVNGQPVLAQLKAMAREVLDASAVGDRLWLVTADGRVRGGTPSSLRSEVDRLEPIGGAGDLPLAVARASSVVRSAGLDARQIAVVTDGQRTNFTGAFDAGDVQVLLRLARGDAPPNHAVVQAEARPQRWTPRGTIVARVLARDSATYRIAIEGRPLSRGTVAPNEEVSLTAAPAERGWLAGTVELEPDELPGDNVRYFALWIGPAPAVTASPGAGPFVRSALDVLRANQRIADGRDILVAPADEVTGLPALITAPTDPVRLGAANRTLERLGIPWRFGTARRGQESVRGARLDDVAVSQRYVLVAQGGAVADTLALAGREPWIIAGPRYVLVGSPFAPEATSLPVRAAFVPWLAETLTEHLVGEPGQVLEATPGQRLARPRWADAMTSPDGARTPLEETMEAPSQRGVHFLERGGRRAGALVVNAGPEESILERAPVSEIERRFRARDVLSASDPERWTSLAFRSASRRSLLEPLLLFALALLVAETVFVRARQPRTA